MIPSRLNLLSPEKRQHLKNMVFFQFIKGILEVLLIIACATGIILLGARTILENYFSDLTSTIVFIQSQHVKTNREVRDINVVINNLENIQKEFKPITILIPEITGAVPAGVVLNAAQINPENKTIALSGEANTRDNLLRLEENIKKISWIQSTNLPLSQLTKKDKIPFALSATMK